MMKMIHMMQECAVRVSVGIKKEITNAVDSLKVDFSDFVETASNFHSANHCPVICGWTEEKHLQTEAKHHNVGQKIPHNTSSLVLFSPVIPPVTITCPFK